MADEDRTAASGAAGTSDLPEFRKAFIQTSLEKVEQVYHQLDVQTAENARLTAELRAADMRVAALEAQINDAESRAQAARLERDQAVAERAVLEALFALIERTMAESKRPAALLQPRRAPPADIDAALREMTKQPGEGASGASGQAAADAV